MYTQWSTFLPLIQPHLPSCPIATIETYLASTTADFCMRTQLWRETYESEYTVANQAEYDLCGGVAKVEAIQWVTCNGIELSGTDPRLIDHTELTRTGQPSAYWLINDEILRLFFIPDAVFTLQYELVLKPSRTATSVKTWIYETWADKLVSGTIAQLARIPGKDWTDPAMAEMHRGMYEKAITDAEIRDRRNIDLRVRQRPAA
jgi:hypothetical protein